MKSKQLVKEPLYIQLSEILRELIHSKQYKIGDQFLTERMICKQFNISRVTANKALGQLISEGVLEIKKGLGTFICDEPSHFLAGRLVSFTHKTLSLGKKPETRILEFALGPSSGVSDKIVSALRLKPDENLYYFKRLRFSNETPVIVESHYLPERFCPGLSKESLEGSLFDVMTKDYHLNVTGVDETILAIKIDESNAALLETSAGDVGFFMHVIGYQDPDTPMWIANVIFRGDEYGLHNRRGPIQIDVSNIDVSIEFKSCKGDKE